MPNLFFVERTLNDHQRNLREGSQLSKIGNKPVCNQLINPLLHRLICPKSHENNCLHQIYLFSYILYIIPPFLSTTSDNFFINHKKCCIYNSSPLRFVQKRFSLQNSPKVVRNILNFWIILAK